MAFPHFTTCYAIWHMLYILSVIFHSISGFQYLRICNLTKKTAYGWKYMLKSKSNVTPVHNMLVHGKWRYGCIYSYPHYLMEASGQLHTQTTIPPRKNSQGATEKQTVDHRASLNTLERGQISCLCWGGASLRLSKSMWLHRAPQDYAWVWPKV